MLPNKPSPQTWAYFQLYYFSDPFFSSIVLCLRTIGPFALNASSDLFTFNVVLVHRTPLVSKGSQQRFESCCLKGKVGEETQALYFIRYFGLSVKIPDRGKLKGGRTSLAHCFKGFQSPLSGPGGGMAVGALGLRLFPSGQIRKRTAGPWVEQSLSKTHPLVTSFLQKCSTS